MHDIINVVCTIDKNYVQHCAVMLTSLLMNNPKEKFNIYLLTDYISDEDTDSLDELVSHYDSSFTKIDLDISIVENFPLENSSSSQYSIAVYYRLLIPKLLPSFIDKVLFLDCDLIIRHSIREFWAIDIEEYALAAIDDATFTAIPACKRLGIDSSLHYFNAGVLLINLCYWRKSNFTIQAFNILHNYSDIIKLQDQDVLNILFCDKRKRLSINWNMLECFYTNKKSLNKVQELEKIQFGKSPAIMHWATNFKPWMYGSNNPFRDEYFKYLSYTRWKDFKPQKEEIIKKIGKVRAFFIVLSLDKLFMLIMRCLFFVKRKILSD